MAGSKNAGRRAGRVPATFLLVKRVDRTGTARLAPGTQITMAGRTYYIGRGGELRRVQK